MIVDWAQTAQNDIDAPLSNLVMTGKGTSAIVKAYNAGGQEVNAQVPTGKTTYAQLTITITTEGDISSLVGMSCDVNVTASGRIKLAGAETGENGVYNAVAGKTYNVGTLSFVDDSGVVKMSNDSGANKYAKNVGVTYTVYVAISGDKQASATAGQEEALANLNEGTTSIGSQSIQVAFGTLA